MLRRCHKTQCNFGNGVSGEIIWFFQDDPNAPFLTDFATVSKFGSASWLDDYDDGSPLGEIIGATRTFTDGTIPEKPCSCAPAGDVRGFLSGVNPSVPPLEMNANGIPIICEDQAAFDYGYDVGFDS